MPYKIWKCNGITWFSNSFIYRSGKTWKADNSNRSKYDKIYDEFRQAVDLVLFAFKNGKNGDLFIQKSPAATIEVLAHAMKDILRRPEHEVKIIGTRHGEKLYEVLMTKEEKVRAIDMGEYFRVPADGRDLNYSKYFEDGQEVITQADEYNSHNTYRLNEEELKKMILDLYEVQDELKEFGVK